jgi:hypothetical protein
LGSEVGLACVGGRGVGCDGGVSLVDLGLEESGDFFS